MRTNTSRSLPACQIHAEAAASSTIATLSSFVKNPSPHKPGPKRIGNIL